MKCSSGRSQGGGVRGLIWFVGGMGWDVREEKRRGEKRREEKREREGMR
jgi:hypothetical protein